MFLWDFSTYFPSSPASKQGTCCNNRPYLYLPYENAGDIQLFVSSADVLSLNGVVLAITDNIGTSTFIPLTAGVEYDFRAGTDPNGIWQLQIAGTFQLQTLLSAYSFNYIQLIVNYNEGGNIKTGVSYEYQSTYCICDYYTRLCDEQNKFGCVEKFLSVWFPIYYGESLDNETISTPGFYPSHCVLIPTKVIEQPSKSTINFFNETFASNQKKYRRIEVTEKNVPYFRMKMIEDALGSFCYLESNTSVTDFQIKVTSAQNFTDIEGSKSCVYDFKLTGESEPCSRSQCGTSISITGCKFLVSKTCGVPSLVGVTDGLTPSELILWNSVTNKNLSWARNGSNFRGAMLLQVTGGSPAARDLVLNKVQNFVIASKWRTRVSIDGITEDYVFLQTQLNGTTITASTSIGINVSSENPNGNPINENNDCQNNQVPLNPIEFFVDYPTTVIGNFSTLDLKAPYFSNEVRSEIFTAVAPSGCTPGAISTAGDNWWLRNTKTGQVYNNVSGTPPSSIGISFSGGGLVMTVPLGTESAWQTYDVWFKDGFAQSNITQVAQTLIH
jgi:hypothetical protein